MQEPPVGSDAHVGHPVDGHQGLQQPAQRVEGGVAGLRGREAAFKQSAFKEAGLSACSHLDEVEAEGVVALHGDRACVLRDDLQTLQSFTVTSRQQLWAETQTEHTVTLEMLAR